jgi:hypothetical protein
MTEQLESSEDVRTEMPQPVKAKRGRPRGDYSDLVGTRINGHLILEVLDGPRSRDGVMVIAGCPECGNPYRTRLRRLRYEDPKGCSCVRSRLFREYLERTVSKLAPEIIAGCWSSKQTLSRKQTAAKFGLPVEVVDAAERKYQSTIDSLIENGTARNLYRMTVSEVDGRRVTTAKAAAEAGLPVEAVQYLISAEARLTRKETAAAKTQRAFSKLIARMAFNLVAEVEARHPKGKWSRSWTPELTKGELRLVKGRLVGSKADLFELGLSVERSALTKDEQAGVDAFLQLARRTLADRRERRDTYLREMRDNRSPAAKAA